MISLTEPQLAFLQKEAERLGISLPELVRTHHRPVPRTEGDATMKMTTTAALALTAALVATPAYADSADDAVKEFCSNMASLAHNVAFAHQVGVPLGTLLDKLESSAFAALGSAYADLAQTLILDIYAGPRFQIDEYQQREMARWRDQTHVTCLQRLSQGERS